MVKPTKISIISLFEKGRYKSVAKREGLTTFLPNSEEINLTTDIVFAIKTFDIGKEIVFLGIQNYKRTMDL